MATVSWNNFLYISCEEKRIPDLQNFFKDISGLKSFNVYWYWSISLWLWWSISTRSVDIEIDVDKDFLEEFYNTILDLEYVISLRSSHNYDNEFWYYYFERIVDGFYVKPNLEHNTEYYNFVEKDSYVVFDTEEDLPSDEYSPFYSFYDEEKIFTVESLFEHLSSEEDIADKELLEELLKNAMKFFNYKVYSVI